MTGRYVIWAMMLFLGSLPVASFAQFTDAFTDGDFTQNPTWQGETARWTIVPFGADFALRTDGLAQADTLVLTTASTITEGTWAFTFRHEGVNLSNANGVRVFLLSDTDQVAGAVQGYFVQFGANNNDRVELFRQDGEPTSNNRVRLGRSDPLLTGDTNTITVSITRSATGDWAVAANGQPLFSVTDNTYRTSAFFGLWVKHSSANGAAFFFDDFDVMGNTASDIVSPEVTQVTPNNAGDQIVVQFSEPLDHQTVMASSFSLSGIGMPSEVLYTDDPQPQATLTFSPPFDVGSYTLSVTGVRDLAGNEIAPNTTVDFSFTPDRTPPQWLTLAVISNTELRLTFDEPLDPATATNLSHYEASNTVGQPVESVLSEANQTVTLRFAQAFAQQTAYTLTIRNIADTFENGLPETTRSFFIGTPDMPARRDLIINEIMYDPPSSDEEFVEVYNRSNKVFDLSALMLSDNRLAPVAITSTLTILGPDEYAVLVRDGAAFSAVFPNAPFIEVANWPTLNNSGDAVMLFAGTTVIDSVAYEPDWGGEEAALERKDPDGPSQLAFNWTTSLAGRGGTPGQQNTVFAPDQAPPQALMVEQLTDTRLEVVFDEPLAAHSIRGSAFSVNGTPAQNAALQADPTIVWVDFAEAIMGTMLQISGVQDLTGNVAPEIVLPIARAPQVGDLLLNEIMFNPRANAFDGAPDQPEYLEFINRAAYPLSLRNAFWTDQPDETNTADTLHITSNRITVPAGAYVIVSAEPDPTNDPITESKIAQAFTGIDFGAPSIVLIPMDRASLSLTNSGDVIRLHRADGVLLDTLAYDPVWHHPDLLDDQGVALERISPDQPTNDATNWTSSVAPAGGTPGQENSVHLTLTDPAPTPGLTITPSPFSPDGDGTDDDTAIQFTLASEAALVRALIFDANGRPVRTLESAFLTGRSGALLWDGRDDTGRRLRIGIYIVYLEAVNSTGGRVEVFKKPVVLARSLN